MTLISPTKKYIEQYIDQLKCLEKEKVKYIHTSEEVFSNPDKEMDRLMERHIFWMTDKDHLIGRVEIRKELTEELKLYGGNIGYTIYPNARRKGYGTSILKLTLEEAKKMGLEKVLLTCDVDNIGSIRIIEKNGGILEKSLFDQESQKEILRYWIRL